MPDNRPIESTNRRLHCILWLQFCIVVSKQPFLFYLFEVGMPCEYYEALRSAQQY